MSRPLSAAPGMPPLPALAEPPPAERCPVSLYLAGLAEGQSRVGMASALSRAAKVMGAREARRCAWHLIRYEHMVHLRRALASQAGRRRRRASPATVNRCLSAVRGVLKAAWRMGLMETDAYRMAVGVSGLSGTRLPKGRALSPEEVRGLFAACWRVGGAAGARDAAALSLMVGAGLRRSEAACLEVDDYEPGSGAVRVAGKGDRERVAYVAGDAKPALRNWLDMRGVAPGPLLLRVSQTGTIIRAGMTGQALMMRLKRLARSAVIEDCSPHDLRRTFVSSLLNAGADLSAVQRLAGHASVETTIRYDRRGESAKAAAASLMPISTGLPKAPQ